MCSSSDFHMMSLWLPYGYSMLMIWSSDVLRYGVFLSKFPSWLVENGIPKDFMWVSFNRCIACLPRYQCGLRRGVECSF